MVPTLSLGALLASLVVVLIQHRAAQGIALMLFLAGIGGLLIQPPKAIVTGVEVNKEH